MRMAVPIFYPDNLPRVGKRDRRFAMRPEQWRLPTIGLRLKQNKEMKNA
jgi:hypothetical protein